MGDVHKQYTHEFKQEAVRQAKDRGVSLAQVARELGVPDKLIYRWKQEVEGSGSLVPSGPSSSVTSPLMEEELARLRRENEVLRREREILKKAMAIFSQHLP